MALAVLGIAPDHVALRCLSWPGITPEMKSAAAMLTFIGSASVAAVVLAHLPRAGAWLPGIAP